MISHEHKAIFIHIPRTGGTSIEEMICGEDMWEQHPDHKHIAASTAKELYAEWWDDYFKFSIVRNPWSRIVSMYRNPNYGRKTNFLTGKPLRFFLRQTYCPEWELSPGTACQYLDEPIDFIGRFENLQDDMLWIAQKLGLEYVGSSDKEAIHCKCCLRSYHSNKTSKDPAGYTYDYSKNDINIVATRYKDDIERFGYKYN